MTELVILGSGSGFATKERFCTSIALLHDESLYLFDCGDPCAALLFRAGIDPMALRTLFISHLHSDHVGGLASLLAAVYLPARSGRKFKEWSVSRDDPWYRDALWFPPRRDGGNERLAITIMMPQEGIEPIQTYLSAVYLAPSLLPFDLTFDAVKTGVTYDDGAVRVTAAPNDHLKSNAAYARLSEEFPRVALESYSFRVDVAGTSFVFSGDIHSLSELDPLLDGVETLVVETAHYPPEDIPSLFDRSSLNRIILTHVHPGLEGRVASLVSQWNDRRIQIARDGLRVPLSEGVTG